MKKSHRKDVIIARVIFAAVCVVLIAIISVVAMFVRLKKAQQKPDTQPAQSQTQPATWQSQEPNPNLPPVTQQPADSQEDTGPKEDLYERIVWTSQGVNLRTEPKENGGRVIMILLKGTKLQITGEAGDWVKVNYNGTEGYVSSKYITDKDPISGKSP